MKKVVLILGIALIFIVGFFLIKGRSGKPGEVPPTSSSTTGRIALPENQEKQAQVSLTASNYNKAVILKIIDISSDVVSVEYEISYITGKGLPRGVLGKTKIGETKMGKDTVFKEILLGSCSKNVCVYDEGVTKIS